MSQAAERQPHLTLRKTAQIAWKGIRVRFVRSLLVTLGIILPIAFLMYVLCSDSFTSYVRERGSEALIQKLILKDQISTLSKGDARIQTRWTIGLALLISFVGILNAMLMSVTERFREIGTMKCLGALDGFIVKLFLLESMFQGIAGTALGILVGSVLAYAEGIRLYGGEVWALIPSVKLAAFVGWCLAGGLALTIAGAIYPAIRAAHMKPVDAMRSEI
jgi:hypothetical protein